MAILCFMSGYVICRKHDRQKSDSKTLTSEPTITLIPNLTYLAYLPHSTNNLH